MSLSETMKTLPPDVRNTQLTTKRQVCRISQKTDGTYSFILADPVHPDLLIHDAGIPTFSDTLEIIKAHQSREDY